MIKAILFDFSRTLIFPKNKTYKGELNALHKKYMHKKDYKVFDNFILNEDLLKFLTPLKEKYDLYIFTGGILQNAPDIRTRLKPIFKGVFSGEEIGFGKKNPQAYLWISEKINHKPKQLLFIDDSDSNLVVAKEIGINVLQYYNNSRLFRDLKKYVDK